MVGRGGTKTFSIRFLAAQVVVVNVVTTIFFRVEFLTHVLRIEDIVAVNYRKWARIFVFEQNFEKCFFFNAEIDVTLISCLGVSRRAAHTLVMPKIE